MWSVPLFYQTLISMPFWQISICVVHCVIRLPVYSNTKFSPSTGQIIHVLLYVLQFVNVEEHHIAKIWKSCSCASEKFHGKLNYWRSRYIYLHSAFFLLQPFVLPLQQYHLRFEVGRVRGDLITKHGGPSTTGVSGSILHGFHLS